MYCLSLVICIVFFIGTIKSFSCKCCTFYSVYSAVYVMERVDLFYSVYSAVYVMVDIFYSVYSAVYVMESVEIFSGTCLRLLFLQGLREWRIEA